MTRNLESILKWQSEVCSKLETQLIIIKELKLSISNLDDLLAKVNEEQKMLNSFISAVKKRVSNSKSKTLIPKT